MAGVDEDAFAERLLGALRRREHLAAPAAASASGPARARPEAKLPQLTTWHVALGGLVVAAVFSLLGFLACLACLARERPPKSPPPAYASPLARYRQRGEARGAGRGARGGARGEARGEGQAARGPRALLAPVPEEDEDPNFTPL
jgi:hypothetical protein